MKDIDILRLRLVGKAVRKHRLERGLKQEDLEDKRISRPTISNIERGEPKVTESKVLYLTKKTGLDVSEIVYESISKPRNYSDRLNLYHKAIESAIDCGADDNLIKELLGSIPDSSHTHYLKGKCYFRRDNLDTAISEFSKAIHLSESQDQESDIVVASCLEMSHCFYHRNDQATALVYIQHGLESLERVSGSPNYKHLLLLNKAIYLRRLDRHEESMSAILDLFSYFPITNSYCTVGAYALRVDLLLFTKRYSEATHYCKEGIDIAQQNKHHDLLAALWNSMNDIYRELKKIDSAERSYSTELSTLRKINEERLLAASLAQIGADKWKQKGINDKNEDQSM